MNRLPRELQDRILQNLSRRDLTSMRLVCSLLYDPVSSLLFREFIVGGSSRRGQNNIIRHSRTNNFVKHVILRDVSQYTDDVHAILHGLPNTITWYIHLQDCHKCSFGSKLEERQETVCNALAKVATLDSNRPGNTLLMSLSAQDLPIATFISERLKPMLRKVDYLFVYIPSFLMDDDKKCLATFFDRVRNVSVLMLKTDVFLGLQFRHFLLKGNSWPNLRIFELEGITTTGADLANFFRANSATLREVTLSTIAFVKQDESTEGAQEIGLLEVVQIMAEELQLQECTIKGAIRESYADGIDWFLEDPGVQNHQAEEMHQQSPTRSASINDSKMLMATYLYTAVIEHVISKTAWPFPPRDDLTNIARAQNTSRAGERGMKRDHAWLYGSHLPSTAFIFGDKTWKGISHPVKADESDADENDDHLLGEAEVGSDDMDSDDIDSEALEQEEVAQEEVANFERLLPFLGGLARERENPGSS